MTTGIEAFRFSRGSTTSFHDAAPADANDHSAPRPRKNVHERYEYIRTPTEPQKISGASTIPATIILVTAKTPQTPPWRKIYDSYRSFGIGMKSGTGRTLV
ncbi:hypothetical protein ELH42_10885 [Rhizobium ruizarguesonis]|uniref:Uncharacterized protein n=1 Tax=Rhizobium ruizarguesonis TaxID=2081791 RepID=A0AB38I5J6_9HYPH|nr:hypothetical protein ELH85_13430 [Rhizobium ruizarguesonis]TAZ78495.1 hypothetical protein ELH68_12290 [Rhizobium ruizarguesonis]TBA04874.1 hypothetical protein ELH64_10840 [Rhizobium ruizarguesonis]TBA26309.1 hypothetical protein ELH61_11160 [Rhizobium ruizarguesonis]TBA42788.1 hypothetical protein ELH62_10685 [Rhizobium ruizarguesonis]